MAEDKKLTDNEIVKALECCHGQREADCENCPNKNTCGEIDVIQQTFDLINRLQEEVEDYKALYEGLKAEHIETIKAIKHYKAEAYKECIEKIEQRDVSESDFYIMVKKTEFDNLLKELAGEKQ